MQHTVMFCVLGLAITVVASEGQAGANNGTSVVTPDKRITKREAIILDNIPIESNSDFRRQSKVIYRRASRPRPYHRPRKPKYGPPKIKYGPSKPKYRPITKYGPSKHGRVAPKKYRNKPVKYGPPKSRPSQKNHPSKFQRRPYGPPISNEPYVPQEPAGFGEPPGDHFTPNNPLQSYGKPPVNSYSGSPTDSYGSPLSSQNDSGYSYKPSTYDGPSSSYSNYAPQSQEHNSFSPNPATSYSSYSPEPSYAASHTHHNVDHYSAGTDVSANIEYTDPATYAPSIDFDEPVSPTAHKPQRFPNHHNHYKPVKSKRRPIANKVRAVKAPVKDAKYEFNPNTSDQIIVGGQYAEPPARYVPKFKPSAQMYTGDDTFVPPVKMALDSEESPSSYSSSYVNYKNSNMAFSPQNLNDAFSITDK